MTWCYLNLASEITFTFMSLLMWESVILYEINFETMHLWQLRITTFRGPGSTELTLAIRKQNWDELVDSYKILEDQKGLLKVWNAKCRIPLLLQRTTFTSWQGQFQLLSFHEGQLNGTDLALFKSLKENLKHNTFFPKLF